MVVNRSTKGNAMFDTSEFYRESCERGFVKVDAIARNIAWETATAWGDLQITINLSKPEKDPRDIAAAAKASAQSDPAGKAYIDPATGAARPCPLCATDRDVEIGYARPIELGGERWGIWYSPYSYYNEHCIAMSWQHRPMHIDQPAFSNLLDFVDLFPQYFIGSNADLPIVGGSILGHDHFQGGRHAFPMEGAPIVEEIVLPAFPNVRAGIVKWPLSVIRLRSASREELVGAAMRILTTWVTYDDASVGIESGFSSASKAAHAAADGEAQRAGAEIEKRHNTVTPIVRRRGEAYEMDLALRCNITSAEHPLGVFHPHAELHHVKKENIGLIEVMGLAILPPRVQRVMEEHGMSRDDVGQSFAQVLEHAGVFKWDDSGRAALHRFLTACGASAPECGVNVWCGEGSARS